MCQDNCPAEYKSGDRKGSCSLRRRDLIQPEHHCYSFHRVAQVDNRSLCDKKGCSWWQRGVKCFFFGCDEFNKSMEETADDWKKHGRER